jgi:type IV secretion system protein VirB10
MRDDNENKQESGAPLEVEGSVESNDSGLRAQSPDSNMGADQYPGTESSQSTVDATFSSVAATAGSKKLMIVVLGAVAIATTYFIYDVATSGPVKELTPSEKIQERSQKGGADLVKNAKPAPKVEDVTLSQAPELPKPPPIQAPQPPAPPPPPVPSAPQNPVFPQMDGSQSGPGLAPPTFDSDQKSIGFDSKADDEKAAKALEARRKASIMVMGSGGGVSLEGDSSSKSKEGDQDKDKDKKGEKEEKTSKDKSEFLGFGEGSFGETGFAKSKSSQIKATQIGRLDSLIAQGKVMNAVLETAINTDLPGTLRAIITRDVYAESGKAVLIPKGSRVIGSYESQVKGGETRVAVVWNRLIRPDGVDLAISAPATDNLGRAGVAGFLDDKFLTKLGNALLISYVVPVVADRMFKVDKNQAVTSTASTSATTGVTTTSNTSTYGAQRAKESSDKFQDIITKTIEESFSVKPTIFVDQGTEITIFANKDMVFPANSGTNGIKMLR